MNEFRFYIPIENVQQQLEFAIEFKMGSETIWENNRNRNFQYPIFQIGLLQLYRLAIKKYVNFKEQPIFYPESDFVIDKFTDKIEFVKEQIKTLFEDKARQSQKIQSRLNLSKIPTAIAKFQEKQIQIRFSLLLNEIYCKKFNFDKTNRKLNRIEQKIHAQQQTILTALNSVLERQAYYSQVFDQICCNNGSQ
ncbi:CBM21_domain superfamily [Hexamita inflata]|uniref:CBM21 domain superfamily n=1 Tax=Hexamita inflata TaxID=28002 RepID=A0AA86NFH9_9EUKA|nr:CBM21 domain superfamily [Hexamita inflata]